jgi:triacylglycerol lipase
MTFGRSRSRAPSFTASSKSAWLNADPQALAGLDCCSLYCLADLMVVPGWTAVLPVGRREVLRPLSLQHHELMAHPASVAQVARELLRA